MLYLHCYLMLLLYFFLLLNYNFFKQNFFPLLVRIPLRAVNQQQQSTVCVYACVYVMNEKIKGGTNLIFFCFEDLFPQIFFHQIFTFSFRFWKNFPIGAPPIN